MNSDIPVTTGRTRMKRRDGDDYKWVVRCSSNLERLSNEDYAFCQHMAPASFTLVIWFGTDRSNSARAKRHRATSFASSPPDLVPVLPLLLRRWTFVLLVYPSPWEKESVLLERYSITMAFVAPESLIVAPCMLIPITRAKRQNGHEWRNNTGSLGIFVASHTGIPLARRHSTSRSILCGNPFRTVGIQKLWNYK